MEIIIPLPQYSFSTNTYKELKSYLKQLELAVHHAQKAVENAENSEIEITDDAFVCFKHPGLDSSINIDLEKGELDSKLGRDILKNFTENYYDELQSIELQINLQ
jgi:hypothetical protein